MFLSVEGEAFWSIMSNKMKVALETKLREEPLDFNLKDWASTTLSV